MEPLGLPQTGDGTFPHHRSFLEAGWGEAKKNPKIAFLSPGEFQHFGMCFDANTTGKPK